MANEQNLKPWKPGQSGNRAGKPKGTKHVSTWIQELLNDERFVATIKGDARSRRYKGAPIEAMIKAQIMLAISGDTRAFDVLLKHGWGKIDPKVMPPGNPIQWVSAVPIGISAEIPPVDTAEE